MTVPIDFKTASADFDKFLLDAREVTGLTTTNQVWGVLLGVFDVFRRRLTSDQCLAFARALPPLLRAAFVEAWYRRLRSLSRTARRSVAKSRPIMPTISSRRTTPLVKLLSFYGATSTRHASKGHSTIFRAKRRNSGKLMSNHAKSPDLHSSSKGRQRQFSIAQPRSSANRCSFPCGFTATGSLAHSKAGRSDT